MSSPPQHDSFSPAPAQKPGGSISTTPSSPAATASPEPAPGPLGTGWASLLDLNRYQWFVFAVAAIAWMADCMDQQLFNLVRSCP